MTASCLEQEGGRKRDGEGSFFIISNTPYVYLRELYSFCQEFSVHAIVNFNPQYEVSTIVIQEDPTGDTVPNYLACDLSADSLISATKGNPRELKAPIVTILANLGALDGEVTLARRTFSSYINAHVSHITTSQLGAIFNSPDIIQGTAHTGMWTGITFRIQNSVAKNSEKTTDRDDKGEEEGEGEDAEEEEEEEGVVAEQHTAHSHARNGGKMVRSRTRATPWPSRRLPPAKIALTTTYEEKTVRFSRPHSSN